MVEKNISLALDDERTGKVAEVLSNKSCKKLLSYLTENEASETELAEDLDMPANTVNYNIKKLKDAGLVEEKDHFWSKKNKRVPVYGVANKKIIISPKKSSRIKSSLPLILVSALFSMFILLFDWLGGWTSGEEKTYTAMEMVNNSLRDTATVAGREAIKTGQEFLGLGLVVWFLILTWTGILIFILINVRRKN